MHKTRNDLAANTRKTVIEILNARLADLVDLQLALKHAHWNVKGPHFIALHEMFDAMTDSYDAHVDDMAERITALGGTAMGSVQAVGAATSLEPWPTDLSDGLKVVEALAARTAAAAKAVRKAIDETAEAGDADAADILTALSRQLDKNLWFLESHLQKG
ncbi:DNA starvation/stationary phase protection protein Dps [Elioraea sp.]|jgi:starvation-inducible DNA-binding protein|uniref:DNA starvation/stationary phase protection protein Dps n=1 Tax=Elioraea sp. TaxID=2185103 RepID=UPI00307CE7D0